MGLSEWGFIWTQGGSASGVDMAADCMIAITTFMSVSKQL